MRRAVAVAVWVATALMDAIMLWVLSVGGFLDQMATGEATRTGADFAFAYAAVGRSSP